ncbi:kelch repeat-containing protein [Cystoisospora suis]|uniref:Kelch repeat-containing protein n=1 Tax=Cystoisospora suis TaxID=483139 RepID=A0A2C6JMH9_9APIC|nr:kelch repeat-containing protein [Cystoisospora suis]
MLGEGEEEEAYLTCHEERKEEEEEEKKKKKTFWEKVDLLRDSHHSSLHSAREGKEGKEESSFSGVRTAEEDENDAVEVEVTNALFEFYADSRVWVLHEIKGGSQQPSPRFRHSAVICGGGMYMYVLGGTDAHGRLCSLNLLYQLDIPSKTWRCIDLGGAKIRPADLLTTFAADGCLHVFGGRDSMDEVTNLLYSVSLPSSSSSSSSSSSFSSVGKGEKKSRRRRVQRNPQRNWTSSSSLAEGGGGGAGGVFASFFFSSSSSS